MALPWLIVNPKAGGGCDLEQLREQTAEHLAAEIKVTEEAGDAERFAREAAEKGVPKLLVLGGDGTLHEVVNGLLHLEPDQRPPISLLPCGTGNDLARTLGLPFDLDEALEVADNGEARPIDLVCVAREGEDDLCMHNAATGGFSTVVSQKLTDADKKRWGALAYFKAAVAALGDIPEFELTITADGETLETTGYAVVVANGVYAGGGMQMAPEAELDDGMLDLLIVTSETFLERTETIARFLLHRHDDDPNVLTRRVKEVTIDSKPKMKFNLDGEPLGETPLTFHATPGALRFVTKPDESLDA